MFLCYKYRYDYCYKWVEIHYKYRYKYHHKYQLKFTTKNHHKLDKSLIEIHHKFTTSPPQLLVIFTTSQTTTTCGVICGVLPCGEIHHICFAQWQANIPFLSCFNYQAWKRRSQTHRLSGKPHLNSFLLKKRVVPQNSTKVQPTCQLSEAEKQ